MVADMDDSNVPSICARFACQWNWPNLQGLTNLRGQTNLIYSKEAKRWSVLLGKTAT